MCRLRNIAMRDYQESVTTGRTHKRTDRRRTKWSLCATMLRRRHKNTRHVFVKHGCPWQQQNQNMAKISVLYFDPTPPLGMCDVSEVWGILRWTYNQSLVTVSSPKLEILHFVSGTELQIDKQMDGRLDDPITRCPRRTFQAGGIKNILKNYSIILIVFNSDLATITCNVMFIAIFQSLYIASIDSNSPKYRLSGYFLCWGNFSKNDRKKLF